MNIGATNRQRGIAIAVLFVVFIAMLYQALERPLELADSTDVEAYNNAVEAVGNPEISIEEKINLFANAKNLSEHQSSVESYSNYNLAYFLEVGPDLDIEKLRVARGLLIEALRVNPRDYDIEINLELVTRLLIQEVKEQLMEAGMSEEKAEGTASEQELGELPSKDKKPSKRGEHESGY